MLIVLLLFLWMPPSWYVRMELFYWMKFCCLVLHCNAQCRYDTIRWIWWWNVTFGVAFSITHQISVFPIWVRCTVVCVPYCVCVCVCEYITHTRAHSMQFTVMWCALMEDMYRVLGCLFSFELRWRHISHMDEYIQLTTRTLAHTLTRASMCLWEHLQSERYARPTHIKPSRWTPIEIHIHRCASSITNPEYKKRIHNDEMIERHATTNGKLYWCRVEYVSIR